MSLGVVSNICLHFVLVDTTCKYEVHTRAVYLQTWNVPVVVGLTLLYVSSNILSVLTKRHCDLLRFISVKSRSTEKESPSSPDELVLE